MKKSTLLGLLVGLAIGLAVHHVTRPVDQSGGTMESQPLFTITNQGDEQFVEDPIVAEAEDELESFYASIRAADKPVQMPVCVMLPGTSESQCTPVEELPFKIPDTGYLCTRGVGSATQDLKSCDVMAIQ